MSRAQIEADIGERCLGHVIGGVREVYDRWGYYPEKKHAFEALGQLVMRIVDPVDNVTSIAERRKARAK